MKLLTCFLLCDLLFYENGIPVRGAPEKCKCCEHGECDVIDQQTPPPIPITLTLPKPKKPEPAQEDNRAKISYEVDD